MRCLIMGYGSIGSRHARLLCAMRHDVTVVSSHGEGLFYTVRHLDDMTEAEKEFDLTVIATPTAAHADDYQRVLRNTASKRILLEKPLFFRAADMPAYPHREAMEQTFVGYNLRFHPVVSRAREILQDARIYTAFFYIGQYLPDWRPSTDYRRCYSASKSRGGGVLRDLSHEMDLACHLTGPWRELTALGGQVSHLEITSDDVFSLLSRHERCDHVNIHLNYLDREKQRFFVVNHANGSLRGDLVRNELHQSDVVETFACTADTSYEKQLRALLHEDVHQGCSLIEGLEVLYMIDAAEIASSQKQWVLR